MVQPLQLKKDIAISVPDHWGDTIVLCWHTRYDIELLRESTCLPVRVTPNISTFSGWPDQQFFPERCFEWKVRHKQKIITPSTTEVSQDLLAVKRRYQSWIDGLQKIKSMINGLRKIRNPSPMWQDQDWIYHHKVDEARLVITGADISRLFFLPLEAQQRGTTVGELAEQVLIMHDLDLAYLAKTESLRVRWLTQYRALADDTTVNIDSFLSEMKKEIYDHQEI